MKILFCTFLLALITPTCKNSKAEKHSGTDDMTVSKVDKNKLVNFPGTSIYIQLANGFVYDETAMGFYKEEDGSEIKYNKLKKMQYAAYIPVAETRGTLVNQQPLTIDGYKVEDDRAVGLGLRKKE